MKRKSKTLWIARSDYEGSHYDLYAYKPKFVQGLWFAKCSPYQILMGVYQRRLPKIKPGQCIQVRIVPVKKRRK